MQRGRKQKERNNHKSAWACSCSRPFRCRDLLNLEQELEIVQGAGKCEELRAVDRMLVGSGLGGGLLGIRAQSFDALNNNTAPTWILYIPEGLWPCALKVLQVGRQQNISHTTPHYHLNSELVVAVRAATSSKSRHTLA